MNKLRLGAAAITLLGVLAAKPPTDYITAAQAAPAIQLRPCTALKYVQNGAGRARATTTVGHYCGVAYRARSLPWLNPDHLFIEAHFTFTVTHAPKQFISYTWSLNKKGKHDDYFRPVDHGSGSCGPAVTWCTGGAHGTWDTGDGQYQYDVKVFFGKEKYVRYYRNVRFWLADAAFPFDAWHGN